MFFIMYGNYLAITNLLLFPVCLRGSLCLIFLTKLPTNRTSIIHHKITNLSKVNLFAVLRDIRC